MGAIHATIFVALTFGLFSVLSILKANTKVTLVISVIVYLVFLAGGLYELLKTHYYFKVSGMILHDLGGYSKMKKEKGEDKEAYHYGRAPLHSTEINEKTRWFYDKFIRFNNSKYKMVSLIVTYGIVAILALALKLWL